MAVDRPGPALALTVSQRPALLPYLALLPTPAVQLEDMVARALDSNPTLARRPGGPCLGCGRHCASGGLCPACSTGRLDETTVREPADWRADLEGEGRLELPPALHRLLADVVGSLDERGLLPRDGPDSPALARVIDALRTVGPPGIAARSGADCVAVQVAALAAAGELPPAAAGLTLDDLAAALGGDGPGEVLAMLPVILARVSPHVALPEPGRTPPPPDVRYRLGPDGALSAEVMDASWFGLVADDSAWRAADAQARAWLAPFRKDGRRLLDALGARAGLMRRLALWLGEAQAGYIRVGAAQHRPLTRADAARALGHHPATIGRVVAGKTARCPDGRLVPLAAFFGGRTALLERLRTVARDHPDATDERLADLLAASGTRIARRTVSKYRALLGVAARR